MLMGSLTMLATYSTISRGQQSLAIRWVRCCSYGALRACLQHLDPFDLCSVLGLRQKSVRALDLRYCCRSGLTRIKAIVWRHLVLRQCLLLMR